MTDVSASISMQDKGVARSRRRATRTSGGMSGSKWRVSSGLRSSGRNGAGYLRILSQSIPLNHGCD